MAEIVKNMILFYEKARFYWNYKQGRYSIGVFRYKFVSNKKVVEKRCCAGGDLFCYSLFRHPENGKVLLYGVKVLGNN